MTAYQWHPSTILYAWDRAVKSYRKASANPTSDNLRTEQEHARILAKYFNLCSPIECAYGGAR